MARVFVVFSLLALIHATDGTFGCLDNSGNYVDWFFIYKLPGGYDIAYMDANSGPVRTHMLPVFERPLDDLDDPVALIRTLRGLITPNTNRSYMMYNDQPDGTRPSSSYGHSKGVIGIEEDSGSDGAFWLLHSTPHFPSTSGESKFYFPEKEVTFGQTFLCMSLQSSGLDTVANQLLFAAPYVYYTNIKEKLLIAHPNLARVLDKDFETDAGSSTANIKVGWKTFTSYMKNRKWESDLYEDLVAPGLNSSLLVETWIRGKEEGSYCKPEHPYNIVDVQSMAAEGIDGTTTIAWNEGSDHAKWAVTLDGSNFLCVGDINRMTTQRDRGGGAVCFEHAGLAYTLRNSVTNASTCPNLCNETTIEHCPKGS